VALERERVLERGYIGSDPFPRFMRCRTCTPVERTTPEKTCTGLNRPTPQKDRRRRRIPGHSTNKAQRGPCRGLRAQARANRGTELECLARLAGAFTRVRQSKGRGGGLGEP
jgi:hypothetical protein